MIEMILDGTVNKLVYWVGEKFARKGESSGE
jgi:hypothetical protein